MPYRQRMERPASSILSSALPKLMHARMKLVAGRMENYRRCQWTEDPSEDFSFRTQLSISWEMFSCCMMKMISREWRRDDMLIQQEGHTLNQSVKGE